MKIKNNFVLHEVNLLCCNALQNIKFQTFVATVLRMCNENIPMKLKNNRFLFYLQYMTDMLELSIQLDTKGNRNTQCLFMVKYTQPQNIPLKKNCCSRVRVSERKSCRLVGHLNFNRQLFVDISRRKTKILLSGRL